MRYKTTSKGTQLPDRWVLPEALRDDTGVIFASVFPGFDSFADEMARHYADRARREQMAVLEDLRAAWSETNGDSPLGREIDRASGGAARSSRKGAVLVRPALPVPRALDGALAIRRIHRRARSEYADQRRLREHDASGISGGGLDPRRPVPPGDRRLGGRHHVRSPDRLVRRGFPGERGGGHR